MYGRKLQFLIYINKYIFYKISKIEIKQKNWPLTNFLRPWLIEAKLLEATIHLKAFMLFQHRSIVSTW